MQCIASVRPIRLMPFYRNEDGKLIARIEKLDLPEMDEFEIKGL